MPTTPEWKGRRITTRWGMPANLRGSFKKRFQGVMKPMRALVDQWVKSNGLTPDWFVIDKAEYVEVPDGPS